MKFSTYSFMVALCLASFWVHSSYATDLTSPTPTPVLLVNAPPPPTPTPTVCAPSSNDVDCDGTPNASDDDADGDGTTNDEDEDDDNDGTSDSQDSTPGGPGTSPGSWGPPGCPQCWCNACPTNTPTPTATPTPTPTPTPCVAGSWTDLAGGVSFSLPDDLKAPFNYIGSKIGVSVNSVKLTFSQKEKTCCKPDNTSAKINEKSGALSASFGAENVAIYGLQPYTIPVTVGTTQYTVVLRAGVFLSGSFSLGGSAVWKVDNCAETECTTASSTLNVTVNVSGGVVGETCKKNEGNVPCECFFRADVTTSCTVSGSISKSCVGWNSTGSMSWTPIKAQVKVGVESCSFYITKNVFTPVTITW